jgi:tetratricopeptide (TPR) repeat protein
MMGGGELALAEEESRAIIARLSDDLPQALVKRIIGLARGWAAGLILLIESRNLDGLLPKNGDGLPQEIFDYFATEVFPRMSPTVRELFLLVAFLKEFTPEMARTISGQKSADAVLARLHRDNCFLEQHKSTDEISYRLHPLCCSFFQREAQRRFDPARLAGLYRIAAEILEDAGRIEAAVEICVERRNLDELCDIIRRHAASFLHQGRNRTVLSWLQALSPQVRETDPRLLYWYGAATLPFDLPEARSVLAAAYRKFRSRGESKWLLLSWAGVVETYMHGQDRMADLDGWIHAMNSLWPCHAQNADCEIRNQVVVQMIGALAMRRLGRNSFNKWRKRGEAIFDNPSIAPNLRLLVGFYLYSATIWLGEWREAAEMSTRIRTIFNREHATPLVRTTECVTRTWAWLAADHSETLSAMNEGLAIAGENGVHIWTFILMIQGVASSLSAGDIAGAGSILNRLESVLEHGRKLDQCYYYYLLSWRHSLMDETDTAMFHQEKALFLAREVGLDFVIAQSLLALAHLKHNLGQRAEAIEDLNSALGAAQRLRARALYFVGLLTRALFFFSADDTHSGRISLEQALHLGRRKGYVNFAWWHCDWMARLCGHALRFGIERDYVRSLIRLRNLEPAKGQIDIGNFRHWPWPIRILTLGHFDLILHGQSVTFAVKPPKKTLALLKLCIALGGEQVSQNIIMDALWPDADGDAAAKSFSVGLARLRRLLGKKEALILNHGCLSLNRRYCEVDVWRLEELAIEMERRKEQPGYMAKARDQLNTLYRGDFLAGEDEPWIYDTRERLRKRYRKLVSSKL